jgi:membrane protein YdbS with pleckstrin-like domain
MAGTTEKVMHYQVTCVCGHAFFLSEERLNKNVPCPKCNRPLIAVVSEEAAEKATAGAVEGKVETGKEGLKEATKRCGFCGEVILAVARKCRYCGEFLDRSAPQAGGGEAGVAKAEQAKKDLEATPVFVLSVSQWDNFHKNLLCVTIALATGFVLQVFDLPYKFPGTFGVAALMVVLMYFFYLAAKHSRCTIRPARLETETGIFSRQTNTLELWRVLDIQLKQSGIERVLGIGTIYLKTADEGSPLLELYQIPRARAVFKYLQEQVPKMAKERGVVYIEK